MANGFDLYSPTRTAPTRHFEVPTSRKFVKQGVFGENGKVAVCGSDHGVAYLFALKGGKPFQTLRHGRKGDLIQAVDVCSDISFPAAILTKK